jgi:hypothetical protein
LGILLTVVLVVAAAGGYCWWKIAGLKEKLVRNLETAIGGQVQVDSLELDFWHGELHAAGITLTNDRPTAPWEKGEIGQAVVRFHLGDLLASTLPVSVEISSWSVTLHPSAANSATADATTEASSPELTTEPSAPKGRIRVTQISAHEGSVDVQLANNHEIVLHGVSFESGDNGSGIWNTDLHATSVEAGSLQADASSVQILGEPDKLTFSELRMVCGQGFITGDGEAALTPDHHVVINLKATDVPVTMLVSVDWQMKLSGLVIGDLTYDGNDQSGGAKGHLALTHAKFNVLPWLGKVMTMVNLPDLTDTEVDLATTDFMWQDQTLHLTNLDIRKNDIVRIAGTVDIDPTGLVDGKLRLGLPSTVTAKWPQLQDKVFSVALENYNWTDVHVTGMPDHLQEDLTPRLVAVGLEQGGSLLDQATKKASDLFKSFMGN